jgi:hypothetical protein
MSTVFLLVIVLALFALAGPVIAGFYLFSRLKQRDPGTSGGLTAAVIVGGVAALVLLPVLVFGVFGLAVFSSSPASDGGTPTSVEVSVPAPEQAPPTPSP